MANAVESTWSSPHPNHERAINRLGSERATASSWIGVLR